MATVDIPHAVKDDVFQVCHYTRHWAVKPASEANWLASVVETEGLALEEHSVLVLLAVDFALTVLALVDSALVVMEGVDSAFLKEKEEEDSA
jgi:hypothetical protein